MTENQKVPINYKKMKKWTECNLFEQWTFSVANPLLLLGATRPLELSDLTDIDDRDTATELLKKIEEVNILLLLLLLIIIIIIWYIIYYNNYQYIMFIY